MNTNQLVKGLRRHLLAERSQPKDLIKSASKKQILDLFLRCPKCREYLIDWPQCFESHATFIEAILKALLDHRCTLPLKMCGLRVEMRQGDIDPRSVPEDVLILIANNYTLSVPGETAANDNLARMNVGPK